MRAYGQEAPESNDESAEIFPIKPLLAHKRRYPPDLRAGDRCRDVETMTKGSSTV